MGRIKLIHYHTNTMDAVPAAENLALGEIAVNTNPESLKMFVKDSSGKTHSFSADDSNDIKYVKLAGGTMTGKLTAPDLVATQCFCTPTMLGEGNITTYFHRLDFGYAGNDKWGFYEYGGTYNFYQNKSGGKDAATLVGAITPQGYQGRLSTALTIGGTTYNNTQDVNIDSIDCGEF